MSLQKRHLPHTCVTDSTYIIVDYLEHFHRPGDKLILASCQEYPPNLAQS